MPLDALAQRFAQTQYLARLEELSKKYSTRTAETVAALAKRGTEHIGELTDARVAALLAAYNQAGIPIDDDAEREINRAAAEVFIHRHSRIWAVVRGRPLACLWKLSEDTVRRLFENKPDVLVIENQKPRFGRRRYSTLRIPEFVVERVHRKQSRP